MTHTPPTPANSALPTPASVVAANESLPGLRVLLDPEALAQLLAPFAGPGAGTARVERLRLKPDTSITAAVTTDSPATLLTADGATAPARQWWRIRALSARTWPSKAPKEAALAARRGLPWLADDAVLTTVVPATADRALGHVHRLSPDSGLLVLAPHSRTADPDRVRDSAGSAGAAADAPDARWLRTLSYNPDRRWVGAAHDAAGRPRELVRWPAGEKHPVVLPWTPGRCWRAEDAEDLAPALRTALDDGLAARGGGPIEARTLRTRAVANLLGALDARWGERATRVAELVAPGLDALPLAPAHGDLTPDQVVVDGRRVGLLDWDRVGLLPVGWDEATWYVGHLLAEDDAPPLPDAPPATLAAALLLYSPDPFRRQVPGWPRLTERLLRGAEEAVAR